MNPEHFDTVIHMPAADIKATSGNGDGTYDLSYPILLPDREKEEFMIPIRASSLEGWREKLATLKDKSVPWAELLLTVSSIGFGAILSAVSSDIALDTTKGKWFFIAFPIATSSSFVAYFFVRHNKSTDASAVAETLLKDMPDPQNSGGDRK